MQCSCLGVLLALLLLVAWVHKIGHSVFVCISSWTWTDWHLSEHKGATTAAGVDSFILSCFMADTSGAERLPLQCV